jgi:antitoxin (DNA-binding transcriptional repressor) of toxin-antitoxin stability system
MSTIDLKEAISDFSRLIDQAINGEFITLCAKASGLR